MRPGKEESPAGARAGAALLAIAIATAALIPAAAGSAEGALERMDRGIGLLEQYSYRPAYDIFARLAAEHPGWLAAHVNLGLAALNLQEEPFLRAAERAFKKALEIEPRSAHALLSLGMLYGHVGRNAEALEVLQRAAQAAPHDPYVLYHLGAAQAELKQREAAIASLRQALRLQPSFSSALYRLGSLYARVGREAQPKRLEALEEFQRLEQQLAGIKTGIKYGEGGRHNQAMRSTAPPGWRPPSWRPAPAPRLGPARRLAPAPELPGEAAPGPAFAAGDLLGDGSLSVVLCGVPSAAGSRLGISTLGSEGAPGELRLFSRDAALCALGDIDGDGDLDLVLAGRGMLTALANDGRGALEDLPELPAGEAPAAEAFPIRLQVLDLDSDWDLDIAALWQVAGGEAVSRLQLLSQNGDGTWRDVAPANGLDRLPFVACELAFADWDGDIDLDLLLLEAGSGKPRLHANDRVWRYRAVEAGEGLSAPGLLAIEGGDLDGDGLEDLLLLTPGEVRVWRNEGGLRFREEAELGAALGAGGGAPASSRAAVVCDFLNALAPSLLLLDLSCTGGDCRLSSRFFPRLESGASAIPLELEGGGARHGTPRPALSAAVLPAASGPELLVYDTCHGARLFEIEAPGTWLVLDLSGPSRGEVRPEAERSNAAGIGATVEVRAGGRNRVVQLNTGTGGAGRRPPRLHAGLHGASAADWVRILWPDGVLQSELGLASGRLHRLKEVERKPSSCPILFAWDGAEFRFVADFLGVGGLGYFQAPGSYASPDASELLWIPFLAPRLPAAGGEPQLELRVLEPLEECTYLDQASLLAVDHPAEVTVLPLEMGAVRGPPPKYTLLAFRERFHARRAEDQLGADVTEALRSRDRTYAPRLERDPRFRGLLRGLHAVELDFGEAIDRLLAECEAPRSPALFLYGYIEYGSSTSNFAAWQAGVRPRAPSFLVEREGRWVPLREEWGIPAGYPRWMVVELDGLLRPGDRRLRIETSLEIAWDEVFLAAASPAPPEWTTELEPARAELRYRGFPADPGPFEDVEGFLYRDFQPWEHYRILPGSYTRYGDVRELLREADDRFVIFGPGDEIALSFAAGALPPLPPGQARSYFWKCAGYCKDTDLYTAASGDIEPLPFRGMGAYPPAGGAAHEALLRQRRYALEWNTRRVSGSPMTPISRLVTDE
jgi:tetratricopeptide (TPR) repeat protein